jgi:Ca2+-binding EF-hand superfamily protein
VISKEEMFHTVRVLGDIPADYIAEKGKMPDEIENLFSLMDFAHDGKISEEEFLRATGHYRWLGQLLIIEKWMHVRNGKHIVLDQVNNGSIFLEMV